MSTPKDIIDRETWSCDDHWLEVPDGERTKSVSLAETPITDGVCLDHNSTDAARARVAACAPDALKILLELEAVGNETYEEAYCWSCGGHRDLGEFIDGGFPNKKFVHDPSCKLLLLLQKAGVR
jgi:hypothetical protein